MAKDKNSLNCKNSNLTKNNSKITTPSPAAPTEIVKIGDSVVYPEQGFVLKPGPLVSPPPSFKEWQAVGNRGLPPVAYETVVRDAPNNALEYELYHGFKKEIKPWEVEQRIKELEKGHKFQSKRYNQAALYYLRKKLEEARVRAEEIGSIYQEDQR